MIRRPLNSRFANAVLDGLKFTTIRPNPWPLHRPIMLYRWSAAPYRSKQIQICPVVVESVRPISIEVIAEGHARFSISEVEGVAIHLAEGFESAADMKSWFFKALGCGKRVERHLMRFRRWFGEEGGASW